MMPEKPEVLTMKRMVISLSILFFFCLALDVLPARSQEASTLGIKYGGKFFRTPSNAGYLSYENEIRVILINEIKHKYGVELRGAESLTSGQLLEIISLLKFKRADESVKAVLSPRYPGAV